jgi:hypothetical protein
MGYIFAVVVVVAVDSPIIRPKKYADILLKKQFRDLHAFLMGFHFLLLSVESVVFSAAAGSSLNFLYLLID